MLRRSALALAIGANLLAVPLIAGPRVEVLNSLVWEPSLVAFCDHQDAATPPCTGPLKEDQSTIFGGLSGLEVDGSGTGFVAISDTGMTYTGVFDRGPDKTISGVQLVHARALLFENGERPSEKKDRDTEGLAVLGAATYVSAESKPRLLRYDDGEIQPIIAPLPWLGEQAPSNMGFEALAIDVDGALFALPEGSLNIRAPFDLLKRESNGEWRTVYQLPRHGGFRPVGADFGDDGHLYVLSRAFNGFAFASQIVRIRFQDGTPVKSEPLFSSRFGQFDNLEGLATWRSGAGELRLYAISDDNFSAAQSTIFVEFQVHE